LKRYTRFCHYIKHNARSEIPSNMLVVDTEASISEQPDGSQHQTFRLGYAIHMMAKDDGWIQTGYELSSIDDFWNLLDRFAYEKTRLYIFAHNMAYDFTILKLDTYLSSRKIDMSIDVRDSVFIVRGNNLVFLSTTNFYKQSLKTLGEVFGKSKMDSPDFLHCSNSELMPYCQRDTEVLALIMEKHLAFIRDNDLGCFKPTISGQSLQAYRHRFMHHSLLVHNYDEVLELERQSYRGGRCEAFRLGTFSGIYYLDINSMYPFVMKTSQFPTKLTTMKPLTIQTVDDLKDALVSGHFIMADCDIILNEPLVACKREKLFFPIGNIRQVITSPEIEYIIEHPDCGSISKIHSLVLYEKAEIFKEFVDFFYNFRKNTDNPAYKTLAKLVLNSLYGKFGQRSFGQLKKIEDENLIWLYTDMMNDSGTNEIWISVGQKYVRHGNILYLHTQTSGEYAPDSIPIIASSVTSYARILLFKLMKIAGKENVLYCDTDSLFVTKSGYDNLRDWISPNELGKLKMEDYGTVEIRGAKDYTFNGVVKMKGIKKNAEKLPNGKYRQYQFQTKSLRYRAGTEDGIVVVKPIDKEMSGLYDKGIVDESGIVSPFVYRDFDHAND